MPHSHAYPGSTSPNPFDLNDLTGGMSDALATNGSSTAATGAKPKKAGVQSLLGEHSKLVNLDDLVNVSKGIKAL